MGYKIASYDECRLEGHETEIWNAVKFLRNPKAREVAVKTLGRHAPWLDNTYLKGFSQENFIDVVKSIQTYPVFGEQGVFRLCSRYDGLKEFPKGLWKELVPHISWSRLSPKTVEEFLKKNPSCNQALISTMFKYFPVRTKVLSASLRKGHTERIYWRPGCFESVASTCVCLQWFKDSHSIQLQALKQNGKLGLKVRALKHSLLTFQNFAICISVNDRELYNQSHDYFGHDHPIKTIWTPLEGINACYPTIEIRVDASKLKEKVYLGEDRFMPIETL